MLYPMSTFEISDKNVVMASFDDVSKEVRKMFEERKKAREEKEMQELLACYMKDHRGSITQIKEHVLPLIDYAKEVHTAKPATFATTHPTTPSSSATPSTSVTPPPYGMPLNYFSGQMPPVHNTSMTL
jgi:hypothetical protein